jgi:hypothetical protein
LPVMKKQICLACAKHINGLLYFFELVKRWLTQGVA